MKDEDGKVRRLKPVYLFDKHYHDTLSLAVARQYFGGVSDLYWDAHLENWFDSPKLRIGSADSLMFMPVSKTGEVLIPYSYVSQTSAYERVSAADVLHKRSGSNYKTNSF